MVAAAQPSSDGLSMTYSVRSTALRTKETSSSHARLCPIFQPIANLQTGQIIGFEALARFEVNGHVIGPKTILPHLNDGDRLALFGRMLERSVALTKQSWWPGSSVYVSVNIEAGLMLADGFCDLLDHLLDKTGAVPEQIVIELLEGERVDDHVQMAEVLMCLRERGVSVALDDIGSGYSSLINLQQLPVDLIKLDSSFALNVHRKPQDLLFILALANLARGLGKRLVIEGVETRDVMDALTILGIDLAQGFAIARPLDPSLIAAWLVEREPFSAHRTPASLLGAYASHLTVVETCRMLQLQPLQIEWKDQAQDWRNCEIGRYFSRHDLHGTCCGQTHRRFHEVLACYETDRDAWEEAAKAFRDELTKAISA